MEQEVIKQKIISYINAAYHWHETGEGRLDEGIGQEMAELEEEILTSFGLPFMAFQYSDIMQQEGFSNENREPRSEKLIKTLTHEAEKFLLAPIEKDTKIFLEARSMLQDAVEVLPMIGITATNYNCFLYYDGFFRGFCNEKELRTYLKQAEELDNTTATRIPHIYNALIENNNYDRLINEGLPFLSEYKEYLKYIDTTHQWDEHESNYDLGNYLGFPDIFEIEYFIIKHIHVKDENSCILKILHKTGKSTLVELTIHCTTSEMRIIILHAKYYSLAIPPLHVTSPKYIKEGEVNIPIKQAIGKNIEIENINIEIEKLFKEDKDEDPFTYFITHINENENIPKISFEEMNDDLPF